jgi:hypothetical protein
MTRNDARFCEKSVMDTPQSDLRTTAETAAALKVCSATLRRWTREGVVPSIRLGPRVIRYDLNAVIAAIASKHQEQNDA